MARRPVQRETLIALKARHAAHRVTADFAYADPLDIHKGYCRACGAELDLRENVNGTATCGRCGADVRVPPYAAVFVPHE